MDLTDPQQMHGYAYANNNPPTWSDPSGLCPTCWTVDGMHIGGTISTPTSGGSSSGGSNGSFTWQSNWACVDYCGSDVDNWLREQGGATTNPAPVVDDHGVEENRRKVKVNSGGLFNWVDKHVLQPIDNVAAAAWERTATFGTYLWDWGRRNVKNPLQLLKDIVGGTVALEIVAAAVAIIGGGGRLRRRGPYCGSEAECIIGASAPRDAITLGHSVILDAEKPHYNVIAHEIQHVYDMENMTAVLFGVSYGGNYLGNRDAGMSHEEAYNQIFWEQRGY